MTALSAWIFPKTAMIVFIAVCAGLVLLFGRQVHHAAFHQVLRSLYDRASESCGQHDYVEAERLYREALKLSMDEYGANQVGMCEAAVTLELFLEQANRYREAKPLCEKLIGINRQAFGEHDPRTLYWSCRLARIYQIQGQISRAESLYKEAIRVSRDMLGDKNEQTQNSLYDFASLYCEEPRKIAEVEPRKVAA